MVYKCGFADICTLSAMEDSEENRLMDFTTKELALKQMLRIFTESKHVFANKRDIKDASAYYSNLICMTKHRVYESRGRGFKIRCDFEHKRLLEMVKLSKEWTEKGQVVQTNNVVSICDYAIHAKPLTDGTGWTITKSNLVHTPECQALWAKLKDEAEMSSSGVGTLLTDVDADLKLVRPARRDKLYNYSRNTQTSMIMDVVTKFGDPSLVTCRAIKGYMNEMMPVSVVLEVKNTVAEASSSS